MTIQQRLGGINHRFTGKEKKVNFILIDFKTQQYLKPNCIFVEIRYKKTNWQVSETDWDNIETYNYLKNDSIIWIPKEFLDEHDLFSHENLKHAA